MPPQRHCHLYYLRPQLYRLLIYVYGEMLEPIEEERVELLKRYWGGRHPLWPVCLPTLLERDGVGKSHLNDWILYFEGSKSVQFAVYGLLSQTALNLCLKPSKPQLSHLQKTIIVGPRIDATKPMQCVLFWHRNYPSPQIAVVILQPPFDVSLSSCSSWCNH